MGYKFVKPSSMQRFVKLGVDDDLDNLNMFIYIATIGCFKKIQRLQDDR